MCYFNSSINIWRWPKFPSRIKSRWQTIYHVAVCFRVWFLFKFCSSHLDTTYVLLSNQFWFLWMLLFRKRQLGRHCVQTPFLHSVYPAFLFMELQLSLLSNKTALTFSLSFYILISMCNPTNRYRYNILYNRAVWC